MNTTAPGVPEKKGVHPGIAVGAIAVVVFGAAGAASYLGLLPGGAPKAPATPVSVATPAQQAAHPRRYRASTGIGELPKFAPMSWAGCGSSDASCCSS